MYDASVIIVVTVCGAGVYTEPYCSPRGPRGAGGGLWKLQRPGLLAREKQVSYRESLLLPLPQPDVLKITEGLLILDS